MKKVLAFIGSLRKMGNCELMAKEISKNIPEEHELRLIRMPEFDIRPCTACYACLFGDKGCVIKDDLEIVFNEIFEADAYMVLAPTYLLGPSSPIKILMDRWLALSGHYEDLWGKPSIGVAIAGIEDRAGYTEFGLESFLKFLLADIKGTETIYGALPGEIFFDSKNRALAKALGEALFGESITADKPRCNLCGGSTFRFLGGGKIRCMLCSNPGEIEKEGETFSISVQSRPHNIFTTLEEAINHREWLKSMKMKFREKLPKIKEVMSEFDGDYSWVKPGGVDEKR